MVIHLFVHCSKIKRLWCTVIEYFKRNHHIPLLSPHNAIFVFLEADDKSIFHTKSSLNTVQILCFCLKKFKSSLF